MSLSSQTTGGIHIFLAVEYARSRIEAYYYYHFQASQRLTGQRINNVTASSRCGPVIMHPSFLYVCERGRGMLYIYILQSSSIYLVRLLNVDWSATAMITKVPKISIHSPDNPGKRPSQIPCRRDDIFPPPPSWRNSSCVGYIQLIGE